jgi:hypothetical protein
LLINKTSKKPLSTPISRAFTRKKVTVQHTVREQKASARFLIFIMDVPPFTLAAHIAAIFQAHSQNKTSIWLLLFVPIAPFKQRVGECCRTAPSFLF